MTRNSLAVAIEALSWIAYAGIGERTALFRAADQLRVNTSSELRESHRIIMETTRFQNLLDRLVSRNIGEHEIKRLPHGITCFLRILAYLRYVNKSSPRELERSVRWGRDVLGWKELHPFEKSIARLFSGQTPSFNGTMTESERLSLETCHPIWYVERLTREFGRTFALKILHQNLQISPTYVRANTLKVHSETQTTRIRDQLHGLEVRQTQGVWRVGKTSSALIRSELFSAGEIVIQDLASIAAGLVASPQRGATVLDMCAAPGNKTSHLAALMQNDGEIYSVDISDTRLSHWKKEMNRTGTTIATPLRVDARNVPLRLLADVVLVDPPCSNTGVFGRSPSLKWRITRSSVGEFALDQFLILQAASRHVRPSGTLLYCTCSILPEENEIVLEKFLRQNPNFGLTPQSPTLGSPGLRGFDLCQRFYPHLHDCNGYFIGKLHRTD